LGAGDAHVPRLTKPWSQLSDLSDDQKSKLIEIHRGARAQIQQILQQERRDCLAILNQKQLDQLRAIEDQKTVDRKVAATQATGESP
jgi:Spy/CpxP family protein refolding chaperone